MTLQEIPSEQFRERSIPVLETERLVLRAPRLGDAKTVATLVNDRRIAENVARIPHPYKKSDAQSFIANANKPGGEFVLLITLRNDVAGTAGADRASLITAGHTQVAVYNWTFLLSQSLMPVIVDLLLGYLLYRSRLVPRILPIVALIGAPLLLASDIATFTGAYASGSTVSALAAFPVAGLRHTKYWSPVSRIDGVYGDRNVFCSCPPIEAYA